MAVVRNVLSEKGRFDFTSGARGVLQAYVTRIQVGKDVRARVLGILESVAAELALAIGFWAEPLFIRRARVSPIWPDLTGMGILVTHHISVLTTQWFQCNPTGAKCRMHFEALLVDPDEYLRDNWSYVTIFAGDAFKAASVNPYVSEAYRNFGDFAETFLKNQETWIEAVTSRHYVDAIYRPTTVARLALWRVRLMIIYGVLNPRELLSSFEEILSKAER